MQPLTGLEVSGRLSHPMDKRSDRTLAWREVAPGIFRAEAERVAGQWDLVIELFAGRFAEIPLAQPPDASLR